MHYKPFRNHIFQIAMFSISILLITSCDTAYYSTMEKMGHQKQDILVDRIQDAAKAQQEAMEHFKSALDMFDTVVSLKGAELKKRYQELADVLESGEDKAKSVRKSTDSIEKVAEALFTEWESELAQYSSKKLAETSKAKLDETRSNCKKIVDAMRVSEEKISPILKAFADQVLFLKHSHSADAIASLSDELDSIKSDLTSLIEDMDTSIKESETLAKATPVE